MKYTYMHSLSIAQSADTVIDIPFHTMFEGLGGYGELVTKREELIPALKRAIKSGKTACINVKAKGVISPIVLATTNKRDKASIE